MKKLFTPLILLANIATFAQDGTVTGLKAGASKEVKSLDKDGWKKSGTFLLNLNQGSLTNWAAGGEQNTLGINALFNYGINYRKAKNTWDNYFDIALGFQNATSYTKYRKTDDRIDITTKYGHQLSKKWYFAVLGNFNSQSLEGFDYGTTNTKISNFLAPGKVLLSAGFDYRPNSNFSLFISPATTRWILKKDNDFFTKNLFGVAANTKSYNEIGAFATAKYTKALSKVATYTSRLDLFSNYKRNPQNVDLFMTNLLALKFNKWLGASVSLDMIYDDDIIKKMQLKEIVGVGVTLSL